MYDFKSSILVENSVNKIIPVTITPTKKKLSRHERKMRITLLEEHNKRLITQRNKDIDRIEILENRTNLAINDIWELCAENKKLKIQIDDLETDKEYLLSLLEKR